MFNHGTEYLPTCTTTANVDTYVNNINDFLNTWGYDGLDIDWEYGGVDSNQYKNFITKLRAKFGTSKLITVNIGVWPDTLAGVEDKIDQINVMVYDMDVYDWCAGGADTYTWYNSATYPGTTSCRSSVANGMAELTSAGMPASKLGIGVPTYARIEKGIKAGTGGTQGVTDPGQYYASGSVLSNGWTYISYADLTRSAYWSGGTQVWDAATKSNYIRYDVSDPSSDAFINYVGPEQAVEIAKLAKSGGYGGVMIYALNYEYLSEKTGSAQYPVTYALYQELMGATPTSTSTTRLSTTTSRSATTTTSSTTTSRSTITSTSTSLSSTTSTASTTSTTLSSQVLVLRLAFDEGAGTAAHDSSGLGNDGTLSGGPAWVNGRSGKAVGLDGLDDYVQVGNSSTLSLSDNITIAAWIKPAASQEYCWDGTKGNYGVMASTDDYADSKTWSWQLRYGADNGCYLGFQFNTSIADQWVTVGQNLTSGEWYHVAATYDGSQARSYLNGELRENKAMPAIAADASNKIYIGVDGWGDYFNGSVDDVRIYRRSLSATEINQLYAATTTTTTSSTTSARMPGDANGDGDVDYDDLIILAASYDKQAGESGYDSRADFNGDGLVGYDDLVILAANYGA